MENNRDTTNWRSGAHNLETSSDAPESGPGWIRTNDTPNDDSGLQQPLGAKETGGGRQASPPEPIGCICVTPGACSCSPQSPCRACNQSRSNCAAHTYRGSDWPASPSLQVTLEDRIAVALAGRGQQRIGQFIQEAYVKWHTSPDDDHSFPGHFYFESDLALVRALEAAVAPPEPHEGASSPAGDANPNAPTPLQERR